MSGVTHGVCVCTKERRRDAMESGLSPPLCVTSFRSPAGSLGQPSQHRLPEPSGDDGGSAQAPQRAAGSWPGLTGREEGRQGGPHDAPDPGSWPSLQLSFLSLSVEELRKRWRDREKLNGLVGKSRRVRASTRCRGGGSEFREKVSKALESTRREKESQTVGRAREGGERARKGPPVQTISQLSSNSGRSKSNIISRESRPFQPTPARPAPVQACRSGGREGERQTTRTGRQSAGQKGRQTGEGPGTDANERQRDTMQAIDVKSRSSRRVRANYVEC